MKIIPVIIMLAALLVVSGCIYDIDIPETENDAKKFTSEQELLSFVEAGQEAGGFYGYGFRGMSAGVAQMETTSAPTTTADSSGASEYSETNIQVEGVDEADIVKNDGKYIYTITGEKVVILDAYPAESARILSEIEFEETPQGIFINGDRLIVFTGAYSWSSSDATVHVYDISDRENPVIVRKISSEGTYFDSRMIGNYVYAIVNQPVMIEDDLVVLPELAVDDVIRETAVTDIYYFDVPEERYQFTKVISINTQNDETEMEIFVTGYTHEMYVSMSNIYTVYQKRLPYTFIMERTIDDVILPSVPVKAMEINAIKNDDTKEIYEKNTEIMELAEDYIDSLEDDEGNLVRDQMTDRMMTLYEDLEKEMEKTVIQKIKIDNGNIEYKTSGEVSGRVLNQFSMDEFDNHFRIATTTGHVSRSGESRSTNQVYVLDSNLKLSGSIEDIAPGERIYSARFMGEKGYLVTFQKVDPFFVLDLSDHSNPRILGELKIPGYSDYLHPYDENHIIGIGKDTIEAEEGNFAWYQGVKMAIFDVTDVSNPIEMHKIIIGDRGTDSFALHDHKAFLFDKEKNLLVIPVLLAELTDEDKDQPWGWGVPYGTHTFQGAFVFDISLDNGFVEKGRITHADETTTPGYHYYSSPLSVKRSLYMDDVLYTISDGVVKMNNLNTIEEINSIDLPYEYEYLDGPLPMI
ncbi:beta-propeller domain-containing protein [Candidatus Aenigmatarchaeota archaeon]